MRERWSAATAAAIGKLSAVKAALVARPARAFAVGAALTTAVLVAIGVATCGGPNPASNPGGSGPPAAEASVSLAPVPSPSPPPRLTTDGCKGLLSPAQVSTATGVPVAASGGDGAAAAAQYTSAVQTLGLSAAVRVCPFGSAAGDQITVVALSFPDPGQAGRMFDTGRAAASLQPVGGVGDVAVSDRSKTLLVRKAKAVVTVYLVMAANPDADHLGPLRAVAGAALAKA